MLILARVEGDHPEATSRAQSRHRLWQGGDEGWQFVIYRHAQGHKDACRRMDMGRPSRPRDRPRYELSEMTGTGNWGALALGHNRSRNALGPALLAQGTKDGLQMFGGSLIDQHLSRVRLGGIHAHVEGAIKAEAETTRGSIQLVGRDPKVEEDAIYLGVAKLGQERCQVAEISLHRHEACTPGSAPLLGCSNAVRITINTNHYTWDWTGV
jgi:hypothetical protein